MSVRIFVCAGFIFFSFAFAQRGFRCIRCLVAFFRSSDLFSCGLFRSSNRLTLPLYAYIHAGIFMLSVFTRFSSGWCLAPRKNRSEPTKQTKQKRQVKARAPNNLPVGEGRGLNLAWALIVQNDVV